jgi:hypothetical protein
VAALCILATNSLVTAQTATAALHACADARGMLRLVSPEQACVGSERRVTWNVEGPAGATGSPGAVGLVGAPGDVGPPGRARSRAASATRT